MSEYVFKRFRAGRMNQISITCGADVAALKTLDAKEFLAISMPLDGVRFDRRTLELIDADHDGRVRTPEVIAAIAFLESKGVDLNTLFTSGEAEGKALAEVMKRQSDLAAAEPSDADKAAIAEWEGRAAAAQVAGIGEGTAAAEAALAKVESVIDSYFVPAEDLPLVTDEGDRKLPLSEKLNPKYAEDIIAFASACVKPVLGERKELTRIEWKRVKAAFDPYRAWVAAKPMVNAGLLSALEDEERVLRYRLHLVELLENYVNMRRLYDDGELAIFQTGTLRIDAKELKLCFHVENEGAHSALVGKSDCCVVYAKLRRPSEKLEKNICAVVTAGTVAQLYVGRNGVFYDRDGKDYEATVTKVVEAQVSLAEAFWAPWRKLGEGIAKTAKKFLGDRQSASAASVSAASQSAQAGGAAMASSIAAIGIGIGMAGAAMASILAAVRGMNPAQMLLGVVALVLVVSLPSVILTWFKLRRRDLGAVLNACGWAINRPLHFSMKRARDFTICRSAKVPEWLKWVMAIALWLIAIGLWFS